MLGLVGSLGAAAATAEQATFVDADARTRQLLAALDADSLTGTDHAGQMLAGLHLHIRGCQDYPYNDAGQTPAGPRMLVSDLRQGLRTGLQCLNGQGPMGPLHPFHEYQAQRLLGLFESAQRKTLQCVEDAMFATAVATSPNGRSTDGPLYALLRGVDHPAVILDTYRLGGILSRRHDDQTYRSFFHLADAQILEHRNGQPLRPANLHRYRDRAGLLFHETLHWLGHEHSALYPDVTLLYEACCFGGSDYISDPERNQRHQQTACNILRDDALWGNSHSPGEQMRLWSHKGYDSFKAQMRADYDS